MRNRAALACAAASLTFLAGCAAAPAPSLSNGPAAAATATPAPDLPEAPARQTTATEEAAAAAARVNSLADAYVDAYFRHFPDWATVEGRADADHSRLPDNTLAGLAAWRAEEDRLLAELAQVDAAALPEPTRITYEFLREVLAGAVDRRACETELWEVSPTWTGWQAEYSFLASVQPVGTPEAREAAVERFRALPAFLDGEVQRLREGLRRGISAPKGNVQSVIEQMDALLAGPVTQNPFFDPARRDPDPLFGAALGEVIDEEVRPAIKSYRTFLAGDYLAAARSDVAVKANAGGDACYRGALRYHTSLPLTAEEVHRMGLEQMERITVEMRDIGRRGFGTDDVRTLLTKVQQPPYTFTSRQQIVDYATAAVRRAEAAVPRWFGIVPRAEVKVVPYPEFRERSAPGGEYQAASDDGSRPGTYYINTYEAETQSKAGIEATAFHEAYPGHHFQISVAKERPDAHAVQRYFGNSGYTEGWALYTERLAAEMGLYGSDVDRLGLLSNEALRAGRLVVDSGMHALGWSRQQAIDYLLAHTAETEARVTAEVDRYIAVPGQATAYMVGNLEIRRLRALAERELGSRFDVKAFHDRVLEDGAVTLAMLRAKIERWVQEQKAAAPGG